MNTGCRGEFGQLRNAVSVLVVLLTLLLAEPTYGQVTLYTNRQSFEAAIPNRTTIDFASLLPPGQVLGEISGAAGLTLKNVNFKGLPTNFLYVVAPAYNNPYQGWNTNPTVLQSLAPVGTTLVVTLPPGTKAVGTDLYAF